MGIQVGSKTVSLEKRYRRLVVDKDMNNNNAFVRVEAETGYYDDDGTWMTTKTENVDVTGDTMWYLFGMKQSDVGLTDASLGEHLETVLYSVLANQVPITAEITATVTDVNNTPVDAKVSVVRSNGGVVAWSTSNTPFTVPVTLNATVEVEAQGYVGQFQEFPILVGTVPVSFTLEEEAV